MDISVLELLKKKTEIPASVSPFFTVFAERHKILLCKR